MLRRLREGRVRIGSSGAEGLVWRWIGVLRMKHLDDDDGCDEGLWKIYADVLWKYIGGNK
jgi:hypothetical protein